VTTDERLDKLTGIVEAPAASLVAHDNQIEALVKVAESTSKEIKDLVHEWQG
jgi:hypothetical protein